MSNIPCICAGKSCQSRECEINDCDLSLACVASKKEDRSPSQLGFLFSFTQRAHWEVTHGLYSLYSREAMKGRISTHRPYRRQQQAELLSIHREEQPGKREQLAPEDVVRKDMNHKHLQQALVRVPCGSQDRPCYTRNRIMRVLEVVPIDPAAPPQDLIHQLTSWQRQQGQQVAPGTIHEAGSLHVSNPQPTVLATHTAHMHPA